MHIFKSFPKHTLIERINDGILAYFELNRAPNTVSSNEPIQTPKYWIYFIDDDVEYVTLMKTGFQKFSCKKFNNPAASVIEKEVNNKRIHVSLHLKGREYGFESIYSAFMFGFFKLIYISRLWQISTTSIGLLGNKWMANKLADRYKLLSNISSFYKSHEDDLSIMLHNQFSLVQFIRFVLDTNNSYLIHDLEKRINPYIRALSADRLINLDRDNIRINDEFWSEYVRLRPKFNFNVSFHVLKIIMSSIVGLAAIVSAIIAVLTYMGNGA